LLSRFKEETPLNMTELPPFRRCNYMQSARRGVLPPLLLQSRRKMHFFPLFSTAPHYRVKKNPAQVAPGHFPF
jgi:hypothetical protein